MYTLAKVLGWIIAIPFVLLALFAFARFVSCGPNWEVVRVAKPVAKIIADDIVKNGIPESLKDIKGLPYELQGCKKKVIYKIDTFMREVVETRDKADYAITTESCYFINRKKSYSISLWFVENYKYKERSNGTVKIYNSKTYTGLGTSFVYNKKNNTYQYDRIGDGYSHHHGILCSAFNH